MPLAQVSKYFPFSRDGGLTVEHAVMGEVHDFPADILPGLLAEGWVVRLRPEPAAPVAPVSSTPPAAAAALAAAGPGADVVEAASKPAKGRRA